MYRILLLILFIVLAWWFWPVVKTGGYRVVPLTNIFDLPKRVEYVDDVTGERQTHDTKTDRYMPPKSDIQIRTVAQHGTAAEYGRLLQLMSKFHRGRVRDIERLLTRRDSEIYAELRRKYPRENVDSSRRDAYQADGIYRRLRETVGDVETYLDLGCNRGGITRELGRLLGARRVMGADVIEQTANRWEYSRIQNGVLPYSDSSIDLVTANMTLHHIRDIPLMVSEIHRVLRPGGYFFIKEHVCWNVHDAMLIDIEHLLYNHVGGDEGEYEMHRYTNYYGWDKLVAPLRYVRADYFYPSLRNEITPTRAYWSIYQKDKQI